MKKWSLVAAMGSRTWEKTDMRVRAPKLSFLSTLSLKFLSVKWGLEVKLPQLFRYYESMKATQIVKTINFTLLRNENRTVSWSQLSSQIKYIWKHFETKWKSASEIKMSHMCPVFWILPYPLLGIVENPKNKNHAPFHLGGCIFDGKRRFTYLQRITRSYIA